MISSSTIIPFLFHYYYYHHVVVPACTQTPAKRELGLMNVVIKRVCCALLNADAALEVHVDFPQRTQGDIWFTGTLENNGARLIFDVRRRKERLFDKSVTTRILQRKCKAGKWISVPQ